MKKIVLTFGLISGIVLSAMLALTLPFQSQLGGVGGMIVGYTTMLAASLAIYFGVRRYRDEQPTRSISFGRALGVGLLIGAISGACYSATWEVIYFNYHRDYMRKYQARETEHARAAGATVAQLEAKRVKDEKFAQLYDNVAFNFAVTFLEPLPVTLLVSLITAAALRKRRERGAAALATAG